MLESIQKDELVSVTIFSLDKGEEISIHASGGDAMVTVLEGKGKFVIGGETYFQKKVKQLLCQKMFHIAFLVKKNLKCYQLFLSKFKN